MAHLTALRIETESGMVSRLRLEMGHRITRSAEDCAATLMRLRTGLQAVSPLGVLERGYALIYAGDGKLVTRRAEAEKEKQLAVRFADGRIEVETTGRPVQ